MRKRDWWIVVEGGPGWEVRRNLPYETEASAEHHALKHYGGSAAWVVVKGEAEAAAKADELNKQRRGL